MNRVITLVGMMGAGKTAVGQELARQLDLPFRDSDAEIERAAQRSIAEIFARDGEAFFRDREAQVIGRLLAEGPMVLSVGGGAWLRPETRAQVGAAGVSVWLDAGVEVLWSRLKGRSNRPLLATEDPRGTLAALLEARRPVYALADIVLPVRAEDSVETTATQLREALAARMGEG